MDILKSTLLLSIFILFACNNPEKEEKSSGIVSAEKHDKGLHLSKAQFENAQMKTGQLSEQPFVKTIQTSGMIDVPPQSRAEISTFAGGYVKTMPLLEGSRISKGQRVVTLENPEFIKIQQDYLETVEQLAYLKTEYERQKTMFGENITSQKKYLKAKSEYKIALAHGNSLRQNLKMLNINPTAVEAGNIVSEISIYSPIDGSVTGIFVNIGSYVSPADKIIEVINNDHIHLEMNVFEKDLMNLAKGQEILFTVSETSNENFKGEVYLIGTSINLDTRSVLVHGHFDKKAKHNFTAGMFVEARIVIDSTSHLALPERAIVEKEDKQYALLIENETDNEFQIHPTEVETGATYQGFTAIKNASVFTKDSRFITHGGFVLLKEEGGEGHSH